MSGNVPIEEFLAEAEEVIDSLNKDLVIIYQAVSAGTKPDPSLLNNIFRAAHSLKGISGLFGYTDLSGLAHTMENMLDRLRMGKIELGDEVLDVLFEAVDMLRAIVAGKGEDVEPPGLQDIEDMTKRLESPDFGKKKKPGEKDLSCVGDEILAVLTEYEEHRLSENLDEGMHIVKLRAAFELASFDEDLTELQSVAKKLGEIITTLPSADDASDDKITFDVIVGTSRTMESLKEAVAGRPVTVEMLRQGTAAPPEEEVGKEAGPVEEKAGETEAPQPAEEPEAAPEATASMRTISQTVRVDIAKLDNLMNVVGELVITKNSITQLIDRLRGMLGFNELVMNLVKNARVMERKLSELQSGVLEVRMVPVGQIFDKLHRNVRKLSRQMQKEVEFKAEGGDTELDKLIIEDLADPLMHIIRNSVDHGIESGEERLKKKKSERALIRLRALQRGNHVVIEIEDDGRGLDFKAIQEKAAQCGLIEPGSAPKEEELIECLFSPGFSTTSEVSEISGRGVGLDVVKENISALSGAIDVESTPGEGTRFQITLPITLAIIQALIVEAAAETFAIPLNSVQQGLMVSPEDIQTIEGREVIELRGKTLPLLRLDKLFGLSSSPSGNGGQGEEPPVIQDARDLLDETGPEPIAGGDGGVYVVKVGIAERGLGIIVDKLWGRQDIVIKSVGEILKGIRGIAGATELGNQRTILVLDVMELMEEAAVSMLSTQRQ